ncbi:MAG TPA: phage tail tip lysozyme [Polyangiaceae bacterium]|jgi:hypothetical protein
MKLRLLATCVLASLSLFGTACSGVDDQGYASSDEELSTNEKAAFEFFVGKGLKKYEAAAIVGNLIQESSVIPTAVEFGGGPGRGIAQWSVGGRWDHDSGDNVAWYASKHNKSRWSLELQLEFVWYELDTVGGYGLKALRASSNITEATIAFERDFEGCGTCDQSKRIAYAKQVLSKFG